MIRFIKRRAAVRSYVRKLPLALLRRFGEKHFYTVEEVAQAARLGHFDTAFLAYAHAIFCNRADFNTYYEPLQVRCTYDGLRETVSRRHFHGISDFDAAGVVRAAKEFGKGDFYESGLGEQSNSSDWRA